MKKWKHINFEQRKTICSCVAHNYKVKDIGELLDLDPTSKPFFLFSQTKRSISTSSVS